MKTERLSSKALFPALLFLLFVTTACIDEKYNMDSSSISGNGEKAVTFSLTLPGQTAGGSTYAMSTDDEEEVRSVEVLLFASGNYVQTRKVSNAEITSTRNKKQFTVQIPEGSYSSIVVLGNCAAIVDSAGLTTADTETTAMAKLTLTLADDAYDGYKWTTDRTKSSYLPIPMWGELDNSRGDITVSQATSTGSQATPLALNLTRMLAKVSVTLSPEVSANFQLQSIQVSNYYTKGSVAPLASNWSSNIASKASIPLGATKGPHGLYYSGAEITTTGVASTGEIYLLESDNSLQTDLAQRTCLVLGGSYKGGPSTFYRVDFVSKTGNTDNYIDILRNHHYTFNVTQISGSGYSDPVEAFRAGPYNLEANLVVWDDAEILHVGTDERYMLGLSQREYTYYLPFPHTAADSDNKLTLFTNYPDGWDITITDDATGSAASWLTLVSGDQYGVSNAKKTVSLLLSHNSDTITTYRSAKISVKAGAVTMVVPVTQWRAYYPPSHSGWAGSNIYWDSTTGKLTFDDVGDQTHKTYQGLYFKWGSLTGISPVGDYDSTTLLYPPGVSLPEMAGTRSWADIPRAPDASFPYYPTHSGKSKIDRAYLYELDMTTGTGDICKYLTEQAGGMLYGKKWRMPTAGEFLAENSYTISGSFNGATSDKADGTFTIQQGYTKTDIGTPFFPAGGQRSQSGGLLGVGNHGYAWAATPYTSTDAYMLSYYYYGVYSSGYYPREYGMPVRCVVE